MITIGIDLGTSSMKLLAVRENGQICASSRQGYALSFPRTGWAEQNPEDWWEACRKGLSELCRILPRKEIAGIAVGGQMHGLVALDESDRVIRPAILWNDGRTTKEVDYLNDKVGEEILSERTGNIAFAGFTAPKLLWMREHEPERFAKIRKILLPKDYLNHCLCGGYSTDYSDASGTLLLDVRSKCWSEEMMDLCGIVREQLPVLHESWESVGTVRDETADELGLPRGIPVFAGAGDNAAAAVGTGTVTDGACNLSLGTSGTLFVASDRFRVDPNNALHSFAHADGRYHLMGCMLSAASCNAWLGDTILGEHDPEVLQREIRSERLGRNTVWFLPYLMGERSPVNDASARGAFVGLSMDTSRADLVQAVLEGVSFGLREILDVGRGLGLEIGSATLCGGGAKSALWRTILASVLNLRLELPEIEEGPGYGAAMLAMVGCGAYPSVCACAEALVRTKGVTEPDPELAARYAERYQTYRKLYPATKELFRSGKE
ncbi:MAG: xylulokinase [Clostridia bacterium]|nr:xylulokinase [Clostridia bacterium]